MTTKRGRTRPGDFAGLLELVRGGYGALQIAAPGLVAGQLLSGRLDARARAVARVLGARQLAQALASGGSPSYPVLALGVEVDLLHPGSMVALEMAFRRRRKVAHALIAASFGVAGVLAAKRSANEQHPEPASATDSLPEVWAERLAGALVPGYARRFKPEAIEMRKR